MNYNSIPSDKIIKRTMLALEERGVRCTVVNSCTEALLAVVAMIPPKATLSNGSSLTLAQIGFKNFLEENDHGWSNLQAEVMVESNPDKQRASQMKWAFAEYYIGSVQAVTQVGQMIIASATGSQLPNVTFTSPNLIFVVGAQKIVSTFNGAISRVRDYVAPLENARMKENNLGGSVLSKILIFENEPAFTERHVQVIFVKEVLGY